MNFCPQWLHVYFATSLESPKLSLKTGSEMKKSQLVRKEDGCNYSKFSNRKILTVSEEEIRWVFHDI